MHDVSDGSSWVYFERTYKIDKIPRDKQLTDVSELLRYDPATRTAIFTIGEIVESYTLPPLY